MKKILASLLCIMMVFCMMPGMAFAEENAAVTGLSGEGTEVSPYLINNLDELKWFRDDVNAGNNYSGKYVQLTSDIDLASEEWEPIGYMGKTFKGCFDGSSKTVSNLVITKTTTNSAENNGIGFFGRTDSPAVIKNLTIENVDISGSLYVGSVVGLGYTGKEISNVHVIGKINIDAWWYAGGIGGNGYMGKVDNCTVTGSAGSYVKGNGGSYIGGIWGFRGEGNNVITNCSVSGVDISGVDRVGGISGMAHYGNTISNCTIEGISIEATDPDATTVGLIAGACQGTESEPSTILNNTVENVTAVVGGQDVSLEANGTNIDGTIPETETEEDFAAEVDGEYYKSLQSALNAAAAGTGNVTVEILSDINLTDVDWNPVTVSAPGYPVVTVNGNNHTISGLNDMLFAGTWAGGSGLIINDLTIADSNIVNDKDDAKGTVGVGAFIGFPQASATVTLNNCHLKDSTVEGGHWTGGLIGMAGGYNGNDGPVFMNLTIKDCSVTGSTITGKGSAGGVIGHASCAAWTQVDIIDTTVSGNTVTSTGSSDNKAGSVMGTIGAAGQPATANGETKTGGIAVDAITKENTVTSHGTKITTIYGRQGTATGVLEVNGGTYEANPIEENVSYAKPAEGYKIEANDDGTYGVVEKVNAALTTTIGTTEFVVGVPTEFTFTTKANDYAGKMVVGTSNFSNADAIEKLEYYEVKDGKWYEFAGDFGPETGFPMSDAASKFRVTFKTAGTYTFTASMKLVDGGEELCSTRVTFTVKAKAPQAPSTGGYYPVTTPLMKAQAAAKEAVADYVKAADYTAEAAAEIASIVDQAKKDIAAAKTVEEVAAAEAAAKAEIDKIETAAEEAEIAAIEAAKFKARSKMTRLNGKKAVKVTWNAPDELNLDGYEVFRSVKRYSGFGTKPIWTTVKTTYTNNKGLESGNTYYYKVRGYKVVNDELVYTDWSYKAWRTIE